MKKIFYLILILAVCAAACLSLVGCNMESSTPDCIRIHIRANSNDQPDQSIKLLVKDAVVDCLTPVLAECETKDEAYAAIGENLEAVTWAANSVLSENGYRYTANAELRQEKFPARKYLEYTFPSGTYDALIIELGSGEGDNWWCVAFPPLCFVGDEEDFYYKSKLLEIIEKYYEVKDEKQKT
jgi:Stage II sporulation protein R (spore_II_R).